MGMCACVHVCVCARARARVACMHGYVCMCACVCVCVRACVSVCVNGYSSHYFSPPLQIGDYLLTLPQQLEPFTSQDSPALAAALRDGRLPFPDTDQLVLASVLDV